MNKPVTDMKVFSDGVQLVKKKDLPRWNNAFDQIKELESSVADMQDSLDQSKSDGFEEGFKKGLEAGRETSLSEVLLLKETTAKDFLSTETALVELVETVVRRLLGSMTDIEKVNAAATTYFESVWSQVAGTIYLAPSQVDSFSNYIYSAMPSLTSLITVAPDADLDAGQIEYEEGGLRIDISLASRPKPFMLDIASALADIEG